MRLQSLEPAVAPDAGLLKPLAEPEPAAAAAAARGPTAAFAEESELEAGRTRDRMLERLLVILNSAALLGVGADFRDLCALSLSLSISRTNEVRAKTFLLLDDLPGRFERTIIRISQELCGLKSLSTVRIAKQQILLEKFHYIRVIIYSDSPANYEYSYIVLNVRVLSGISTPMLLEMLH